MDILDLNIYLWDFTWLGAFCARFDHLIRLVKKGDCSKITFAQSLNLSTSIVF